MSLILSGTNGVSDVDGTAATPAIRGTDTNTGIFFPAADTIAFAEGGVESARFDSAGNLGIGTSSPDQALVVNRASGSTYLKVSGANNVSTDLAVQFTDGANTSFIGMMRGTSGGIAGALHSYTGGAIRATLDSSGNLGLGVTPSAWGSGRGFEIGAAGNGLWSGSGYLNFMQNTAFTSGAYRYVATGTAARFEAEGNVFKWLNAPSGTAGNAISFTQAMTLDASGNRMLGTTTPALFSGYITDTISGPSGSFTEWQQNGGNNFRIGSDNSAGGFILTTGATPIRLFTNGAERARIDSSGNLLVGTTNSSMAGLSGIRLGSGNAGIVIAEGATNRGYFFYSTISGAVTWETVSGTGLRAISGGSNGVFLANGGTSWSSLSDERHKDIIEPIADAADKVASLRAVIGKYKTDVEGTRRAFLIAQDVKAVLPEAVDETDVNNLALKYSEITPLLVAAIQEQQAIIQTLTTRIAALEAK